MNCIHNIINKEVKAPIKLDWRIDHDTFDSEIVELVSTHSQPMQEDNTLDKTDDGGVAGMGPDFMSLALPESSVNTFDKCTRRKPITSLGFYGRMETGIKHISTHLYYVNV
jgi:hypothetical protein